MSSISNKSIFYIFPIVAWASAVNALLPSFLNTLSKPFSNAVSHGFGHNYVLWLSLILSAKVLLNTNLSHKSKVYLPYLSLLSIFLILPSATTSWLICSMACVFWFLSFRETSDKCKFEKASILILLAISIREPVCQLLLSLFSNEILRFDAWASGSILDIIYGNTVIQNNLIHKSGGHSLLILTGCSALSNISWALLLWMSLTLYIHSTLKTCDYWRVVGVIFTVLVINCSRLALMALEEDYYRVLHQQGGSMLIETITLVLTAFWVKWR